LNGRIAFSHETDDEEDKDMKQKLIISRIEDISESETEDDPFFKTQFITADVNTAEMLKVVDENKQLHTNDVINTFVPNKDYFQCFFDGCTQ
jgi:hypothetical protein